MATSQPTAFSSFTLTLITGLLLIILGTAGVISPNIMSLATVRWVIWSVK